MQRFLLYALLFIFTTFSTVARAETDFEKRQSAFSSLLEAGKTAEADAFFLSDGGTLYLQDEITNDVSQRQSLLNKLAASIRTFDMVSYFLHSESQAFQYGIYHGWAESYASCIAWKKVDGVWFKELEVICLNSDNSRISLNEIELAREGWVTLSNAHDHSKLIDQLYGESGFYVNSGVIYRGYAEILEKYAYMSQPSWTISLHVIDLIPVDKSTVIEIGTYRSNGVGHYCILWKKELDQSWWVRLDFNF